MDATMRKRLFGHAFMLDTVGRSGVDSLKERTEDPNRPYYVRYSSCIGICMDLIDAEPEQEKAYGLKRYFMMELTDRLYEAFTQRELSDLKGDLDRQGLFKGMIIEGYHQGITLVLGFDYVEALDATWRMYKSGELGKLMHKLFITDELLKRMRVRFIEIRTRMWEDEYLKCRNEITSGKPGRTPIHKKKYDLEMATLVKDFQKDFTREVHSIRDEWTMFELNLGEFKKNFKACVPNSVTEIKNLKHLKSLIKVAVKSNVVPDATILNDFEDMLKIVKGTLDDIEERINCPLLQIHSYCESDNQHEVKKNLIEIARVARGRFDEEYELTELKHPDWSKKIKDTEQGLLLGIISCMAYGVDAIMDVDQLLDEYCAALNTPDTSKKDDSNAEEK